MSARAAPKAVTAPAAVRSSGSKSASSIPCDEPVPPGAVGEIVVRGDTVMMGYWERPEETKKAVIDGWMHTGDGGYMDEDGYVYIVDRIKDMIISGGENIYSAEVENCIAQHPAVAQCAVIGIPHEKWGEAVHAVVMRKSGAAVTGDDIIAFCKERIAHYKCPRQRPRAGRDAAALRRRKDPQAGIAQALLGSKASGRLIGWKGRSAE